MSNTRHANPPRRPPDEIEAAFRDELRTGCPYCHSRTVVERFRGGVWDYGLRCDPSCRTFTEPQLAHRLAAEAAKRGRAGHRAAAVLQGVRLRRRAG